MRSTPEMAAEFIRAKSGRRVVALWEEGFGDTKGKVDESWRARGRGELPAPRTGLATSFGSGGGVGRGGGARVRQRSGWIRRWRQAGGRVNWRQTVSSRRRRRR